MPFEPSHRTKPEVVLEAAVQTREENVLKGIMMQAHALQVRTAPRGTLPGSPSPRRTLPRKTPRLAALAAAAVLALAGAAAMAQSAGWHGHGHGHGNGPGAGIEIERVLVALKGQLALNTSQQLMWDNAVAQTRAAHAAGRESMHKVRATLAAELAKAEPDLAAVAAAADSAQNSHQALRHGVRNQWLQIYATFSPEQKAIVRDALTKQLARREAMGARMREHLQKGG
jgi:Spy/CpxP family protein refolding chaperone